MKSCGAVCLLTFATSLAVLCVHSSAQQPVNLVSPDQTASTPPPPNAASADDDKWHVVIAPYLWFAGMHGTIGGRGYTTSVHASFGDIFDYLNIGLMAAVEARKNRILLPLDFMWMKLSDDRGLPLSPDPNIITSIKVKVNQTMLTPKVGYRLVDNEKLKADALVGFRYFHLGNNFSFQPSGLLGDRSVSADWADVVAGARFTMPLSPKAEITILGDAGGGGADLDYQFAALLGYRIKPKIAIQAGWRYLDVNYRPSSTFVYDIASSGLLLGVTFNVK
ncbi:hypothetical protein [Edaphobacter aggregans]|uniref:hypothetical protein n=1 Tax=Edaphobacter aggregans TaxID=570835 RepID=UPI0012F7D2EF|nr:hypothetical protein [Edaphobacter aggregans]